MEHRGTLGRLKDLVGVFLHAGLIWLAFFFANGVVSAMELYILIYICFLINLSHEKSSEYANGNTSIGNTLHHWCVVKSSLMDFFLSSIHLLLAL